MSTTTAPTVTSPLTRVGADLWETRADAPFPGLTTHAYLWVRPAGNVLLYSVLTDADLDAIDALGGVAHQYLSHVDEAGPMLRRIVDRGATLHAPAAEAEAIGRHAPPAVLLDRHHVDANGIEVIPAPGHTPGSTAYLLTGIDGTRYLFVGDTAYRGADGRWRAGFIEGMSDAASLRTTLERLATLDVDVVISSAFAGETAVHPVGPGEWAAHVAEALTTLDRL
jgi:glyoxylase-like metal-dependent hydrolase (beta-lactamase superfamily II)